MTQKQLPLVDAPETRELRCMRVLVLAAAMPLKVRRTSSLPSHRLHREICGERRRPRQGVTSRPDPSERNTAQMVAAIYGNRRP